MPAQQGLGPDEEASLASSRQKPTQSSEYRSIRWSQGRTGHLAAQDGDLDGQVLLLIPRETYQPEHADEGKVEEESATLHPRRADHANENPGRRSG